MLTSQTDPCACTSGMLDDFAVKHVRSAANA